MRKALSLFTLAFAFAALPAAEEFGPVSLEQLPAEFPSPTGGYLNESFRLFNRDPLKPVAVELDMVGDYGQSRQASRQFLLPPGGTLEGSLYWPHSGSVGRNRMARLMGNLPGGVDAIFITVNGKRQRVPTGDYYPNSIQYYRLFDQGLRTDKEIAPLLSLLTGDYVNFANLPLAQWPLHPRRYAGVSEIWLDSREAVPEKLLPVLEEWLFAGGTLVTLVPRGAPWPDGVPNEKKGWREESAGLGRRIVCRPFNRDQAKELEELKEKDSNRYHHRSWEKHSVDKELLGKLEPLQTKLLSLPEGWPKYSSSFDTLDHQLQSKLMLPVPTVSASRLFVVMLIFVVLIGPVNYLVLRRKKREPWLLVTMPVISAAFCLVVIGYVVFEEGWRSIARITAVTYLDQTRGLAATRADIGFYTPSAYRRPLAFAPDDYLVLGPSAGPVSLRLEEGQLMAPGVIRPRIPLYYQLNRCGKRNEQLKFDPQTSEDTLTFVNGLGGEIEELTLVDGKGRYYTLPAPLPAGAKGTLKFSGRTVSQSFAFNAAEWAEKAMPRFDQESDLREAKTKLSKGFYLARLKGGAFYSPGIVADDLQARHLVIGKF